MKVYNEIPLGESDPNKSDEQKKLEHELICLITSWRPDKERLNYPTTKDGWDSETKFRILDASAIVPTGVGLLSSPRL